LAQGFSQKKSRAQGNVDKGHIAEHVADEDRGHRVVALHAETHRRPAVADGADEQGDKGRAMTPLFWRATQFTTSATNRPNSSTAFSSMS
jgi:hypothetical protein